MNKNNWFLTQIQWVNLVVNEKRPSSPTQTGIWCQWWGYTFFFVEEEVEKQTEKRTSIFTEIWLFHLLP